MNHTSKPKFLILATALSLGFVLSAAAQGTEITGASASVSSGAGLIGSSYSSVSFRYTALNDPVLSAARGVGLEFNQALDAGYDLKFTYTRDRASADPVLLTTHDLNGGVVAYGKYDWGRPFVQALVGWEWQRGSAPSDNSFAYTLGTGVEFRAAPAFFVTPYLNFVRVTDFNRSRLDYGLKATYRVNREWSVSGGWEYNSVAHQPDHRTYTIGVNYHF